MAVTDFKQLQTTAGVATPLKTRTLWYDAWLRLRRNKVAVASVIILLLLGLVAILYPILQPDSYTAKVKDPLTNRFIPNEGPSAATDDRFSVYLTLHNTRVESLPY